MIEQLLKEIEASKKGVYTKPRLKMKHLSTLFAALVLWSAAGPQDIVAKNQRGDRPTVSRTSGFGVGVGINYVWFFQPRWGLQTGIEWQSYNTRARLDPQEFRQTLQYEDYGQQGAYQMDFVSNVRNFSEKQRAGYAVSDHGPPPLLCRCGRQGRIPDLLRLQRLCGYE